MAYGFNNDRSRVDMYTKAEIDAIEIPPMKKRVILIGDSYGQGWTPDGSVDSWIEITTAALQNVGYSVSSAAVGGYGFATGGFYTLLQNIVNGLTDIEKAEVTTVVFGGGYNDKGKTLSAIRDGMSNCINFIHANLPLSIDAILAPFGMCAEGLTTGVHASTTYSDIVNMVLHWNQAGIELGFRVLDHASSMLRKSNYFSSDYVHPNQNGQYVLADFVINGIHGSTFSVETYNVSAISNSFDLDPDSTVVAAKTVPYISLSNNDITTITFTDNVAFSFNSQITIVANGGSDIIIPISWHSIERQPFNTQRINNVPIQIDYKVENVTHYVIVPGLIRFTSDSIKIRLFDINDEKTNYRTINNVTRIMPQIKDRAISFTVFYQQAVG